MAVYLMAQRKSVVVAASLMMVQFERAKCLGHQMVDEHGFGSQVGAVGRWWLRGQMGPALDEVVVGTES